MKEYLKAASEVPLYLFCIAVLAALLSTGCPPPQETARDSILTARAVIETAQQDFRVSCQGDPSQRVCGAINRAVDAHNLAVDALDVYCAGGDWNAGGVCQPPSDPFTKEQFEAKLRQAVANLDSIIREIRDLSRRN